MAESKWENLEKLHELLNQNKQNLGAFLAQDVRGQKTLEFIKKLAESWREEQNFTTSEIKNLNKNIVLIKEIISTQQSLSKTVGFEQIISVNELLNEALLITGLDLSQEIRIEKNYGKLHSILTDKVKLLQVFVNLLRNAKEALMESTNPSKQLVIKSSVSNTANITIEISENGIGIPAKNINKIFNYGFTTKETGHGFDYILVRLLLRIRRQ